MKITCDFCKTEYKTDRMSGPVKCAICGHVWAPKMPRNKNSGLVFFAAITALLAAIVFTVAVISRPSVSISAPLVAYINEITTTVDDTDVSRFVISGRVENTADAIYGMPDLIVISWDENGNEITRQKFMPSATLLEPGAVSEFKHTLSVDTSNVKKITVELAQ